MARRIKIIHDRENCIGCGACAAMAPNFWTMNDDGKSDLVGGNIEGKRIVRVVSEKDLAANEEAAQSCPVEIIHLEDEDTKKKIV